MSADSERDLRNLVLEEVARQRAEDWTIDPQSGRTNSSERYIQLAGEVEQMIRNSAFSLLAGRADSVARLIISQLAHAHRLVPRDLIADYPTQEMP